MAEEAVAVARFDLSDTDTKALVWMEATSDQTALAVILGLGGPPSDGVMWHRVAEGARHPHQSARQIQNAHEHLR